MDVAMLLSMASQAVGDRTAVSCGDEHLTYAELQARAARYATVIRQQGLSAVAFVGENSPEAVALFFGCSIAGASYVPVNYRWTDAQLAEALTRIAPIGIVTDDRSAARVSGLEGVVPLTNPGDAPPAEYTGTDAESPAVMLFTSGTSGTPKAVVLRNRNLVPYVLSTVDFLNAGPDEAILVSVPPYHIAAVSSVLTSIYAGRRMVLMPAFDPDEWVATARREAVTQAMVVPTMLNRILDVAEWDGKGIPTLKHLSYGGGRMPVPTIERAIGLLPGLDLVNAYGLTETSSTITLLSPQDHRDAVASEDPSVRARLGSVGKALPTVEIEIRDDQGRSVPSGEAGEVWVRGEQVSGEYLSHSATDSGGWYPTRDHGHLDEGGFLFLHGRADDVIVRGGENIAPAEVEERLLAHPAVAEVAVVGVPDTEWGERIEAFVVPNDGAALDESELREWVRSGLRSTRVPEAIHQRDELPYNETGKLLRRQLKAERATELAEEVSR
ncbi:AMP-dependent synthetase [Rhodococcus pyridinivorans KG-16]|uniref:AMP-dependent synthetase n=1 Tax=Rhodococcus pyridinivorans KG-16 TaxID=1441730 RepID=A0A0V9UE28_9NOCA|nr:AMP-binding protein [Rhodococcus pyridinivorans]KSZ56087.1 AMP-dependent synthetase [Rhodococcus pyridinivorans KG-16]